MNNVLRLGVMVFSTLAAVLVLLCFLVYVGDQPRAAQQASQEQRLRLANLAGSCASSVGSDGYGVFRTSRPTVISGERGDIRVPCKIELRRGGSLRLSNVDLISRSLIISDFEPNEESRVTIEGSTLTGTGEAGFLTQLSDSSDSIAIERSTVDYPLGVWARATGTADASSDGGRIDVTDSTLRSLDSHTDGIQLTTGDETGIGNFVDLKLETVQLDSDLDPSIKRIMLLAGDCRLERVEGYSGACDPEDMVQQQ